MKKFFILLMAVSSFSFAESTRSMFLEELPHQCNAEDIINEIPLILKGYDMLEVIDVTNVQTFERSNNQLVCAARLVTEKGEYNYKIIFRKNSMGQIIVNY